MAPRGVKRKAQEPVDTSSTGSSPSNSELLKMMRSLHAKMDQSLNTSKQLTEDVKQIKEIVSTHDGRIGKVEQRIDKVEYSVNRLGLEQEYLQKEINKVCLIFDGLPDSADESEDDLYRNVKLFMSELVDEDISFDTAYRLGKYKPNFRRPIRVRFLAMCQRNLIYSKKSKLHPPFYINEDLPFSIRRDHAILRNKKKEAIQNGTPVENISVDWKLRTITINQDKFKVIDGALSQTNSASLNNLSQVTNSQVNFLDRSTLSQDRP